MRPHLARAAGALALLVAAAPAAAAPSRSAEAGGEHIRLETPRGPVHVWIPAGYQQETAGIALYVHGYYTGVDRAWTEHHLAEQFAASERNALFIAPEAPAGLRQEVAWPELADLLLEVRRQTGLLRPWGPVVAMVHSGGYRTAVAWLDHRPLEQLILLDAMYGEEEAFVDWIGRAPANQLLLVGADTIRWTEPLIAERRAAGARLRVFDRVPDRAVEVDRRALRSPLVYFRCQLAHMELVEGGRAIPLFLALTRLRAVERPGGAGAR